ncbi:MAG TPA: substrate-binding domain-containing protein, partial [Rhodothermales bacterium]
RSLITARTNTLGVLLPDLYGEFFSEVIRGIDQTARGGEYHLIVSSSHNEQPDIEAALKAMRGRVDGLIVMSPHVNAASLTRSLPSTLPAVLLNCATGDEAFDSVGIDNRGGAASMVRHLLELGHRRIAVIKGTANNFDSAERLAGYRELMQEAGTYDARLEANGDFTEESGYRAAQHLVAQTPRPTAIFAFNDSMAAGALSALQDAGLRVPEDVSVGGFDDVPMSAYLNPPLTSVHVPIAALGASAMSCLLEAIRTQNRHERTTRTLETTLILRRSTGMASA